jgi:hypothetical protein
MTGITLTATVSRFTRQHTHPTAFQPERPLCAETEPTVSVSIEVGLAPIMGALQNGSNALAIVQEEQ